MEQHTYLASGWCICGHHRADGRNERDQIDRLTRAEIRALLDTPTDTKDSRDAH